MFVKNTPETSLKFAENSPDNSMKIPEQFPDISRELSRKCLGNFLETLQNIPGNVLDGSPESEEKLFPFRI